MSQASVKVGLVTDQTGPLSFLGIANTTLARMVVDETNAAGGLLGRRIELITEDSATDDTVAAAKAKVTQLGLVGASPNCGDAEKVSNQLPAANAQVSKGDSVSIGCSKCSLTFCVDVRALPPDIFTVRTN